MLQYDEGGPRAADYGIEVVDVSLHPDSAHVRVITYEMHPRFLYLQTEDANDQDEWGPEWDGLGAGRLHGVQVGVEYTLTMDASGGDDLTDPESWLIHHLVWRYAGGVEEDLNIGSGDA